MTEKDIKILVYVKCITCGKTAQIDLTQDSKWTKNVITKKYYCPKCSVVK